jgi:hypothetical protein
MRAYDCTSSQKFEEIQRTPDFSHGEQLEAPPFLMSMGGVGQVCIKGFTNKRAVNTSNST